MEKSKRAPRLKLPARAGIWNIVSAFVARGVGVVGTPIFTRLLTPSEYGLYPLYTTWLGVFSSVLTLGLTGGAILRGLQRYEGRRVEFLSAAMGLFLTVFALGATLVLLFLDEICAISALSAATVGCILCEVLLSGIISFMLSRWRYEYNYRATALVNILNAIGTPILSVTIVRFSQYHAQARIIGSVVVSLIIALPLIYSILRESDALYDGEIWRYLISVSLPLLPHLISSSLILRAAEMVIAQSHGGEALGKYSVAISVGLGINVLTNGLSQVFAPWVLRRIRSGEIKEAKKYIMLTVRALVLCALLALSVAPELISIITPPPYHDALPAVYPLMLSAVATFVGGVSMSASLYYEKNSGSSLSTVIVAALSVAAAVLFLPHIDYRFAGVFTLLGYALLAILNSRGFFRLSKERIIDTGAFLGSVALGALYALLLYLLRGQLAARLILGALLLPMLFSTGRRVWIGIKEL